MLFSTSLLNMNRQKCISRLWDKDQGNKKEDETILSL